MLSRRTILQLAAGLTCMKARGSTAGLFAGDPGETADFAHRIFALINEVRETNGVDPLAWSEPLAACAREQSSRKAVLRFEGHFDPERGGVSERLTSAGIGWSHCGENLFQERGWDDPVNSALVWWWYSPGHKANLLNADYTETGLGLAKGDDETWFATQIFLTPPRLHRLGSPPPAGVKPLQ